MKAIILAGGIGTRLRPLTYEIPKPLLPVQGKTLTEHVFDILKTADVDEVYLSIGHMADKIKEYFKDGKKFGIKIKYLVENEPLGTGGWMHIMQEKNLIPEEDFIVLNGDNLFDIDFKEMHEFHKKEKALITLSLYEIEDVESRGVVAMQGNKVVDFVEKPKKEEAPSHYISAGYYIFSPEVFKYLPKEKKFMLENHLFPVLAKQKKVAGFISKAQWFDTGTFDRWQRVIEEWRKKK
jgi:NDP-sugar pyrophosphorylase family protein